MRLAILVIVMFSLVNSLSCVTVSIPQHRTTRAGNVLVRPPGAPYVALNIDTVDRAWKSTASGSIISYLSECGADDSSDLEELRSEIINQLAMVKVVSDRNLTFQGRAAMRGSLIGQLDGVDTAVEILVFKKNGCDFVLSLVATPTTIAVDRGYFEKFIEGFQVP